MEFNKNYSSLNILDFFVADYKQKIYYLFQIVNSNIVKVDDLIDKNLIKSLNWYFSKKQKIIILYKGQNFIDKENNFIYLNIDYFLTNFNEKENLEFILENSK